MDYSYRNPTEEGPTVDIWQGHTVRKPPQYKWHWNVESIWKQSGCWLRKIVWTMMKDQKESFMNRNPSEERPTVDKGQKSQMIDWDGLFGNNQAADWGRLFDMMKDQKESFMDKGMLQESTPAYMVQGSQNAEWGRLFKESDYWLRQISWTPVSDNSIRCREYKFEKDIPWGNPPVSMALDVKITKPSEEGPTVDIWTGHTVRKPPQYKQHLDVESTHLERTVA